MLQNSDNLSKNLIPETYMGYCYFKLSKYKEAEEHLQAALSKNINDAYALFYKACVAIAQKQNEAALNLIEQALKTKKITVDEIIDEPVIKEIKKTDGFKKLQKQYSR